MNSKKKLLIIDDDPMIQRSFSEILQMNGYDVEVASTAHEGVDKFSKDKFDFIFLDMMMEKTDSGIKVIREIRKGDKKIPVYLLSASAEETASHIEIGMLGFQGIFQKPVEIEDLLKEVRKIVGD